MSEMYLEDGTKVIIVISPDSPSGSEDSSSQIGVPSVRVTLITLFQFYVYSGDFNTRHSNNGTNQITDKPKSGIGKMVPVRYWNGEYYRLVFNRTLSIYALVPLNVKLLGD